MIELSNLSKNYIIGDIKVTALDNVSLKINEGEFVVILGPSGSGKTTLLNLIGALDSPSSGLIKIQDRDISKINRKERFTFRREKVGFIFQSFNLFPTLCALENVQYIAELTRLKEARDKSIKALEQVGLGNRIHHFPHQLSGGEQQRVAIARALVKEAPLILADEPTGELDFKTGRQILRILKQQPEKQKQTIIIVTHNREIARVANRVVELHSGSIANDGAPKNGFVEVDDLEW